jgi:hypothetical protein
MLLDKEDWLMRPKLVGHLPSGRALYVIRETGNFSFKIEGGGKMPRALQGEWRKLDEAIRIGKEYLSTLTYEPKEKEGE